MHNGASYLRARGVYMVILLTRCNENAGNLLFCFLYNRIDSKLLRQFCYPRDNVQVPGRLFCSKGLMTISTRRFRRRPVSSLLLARGANSP